MVVRGDEVQACDQVHCQHSSEGPPVVRQSWRGRGFYNLGSDWLPLVAVGCTDQSEAPTHKQCSNGNEVNLPGKPASKSSGKKLLRLFQEFEIR